MGEVTPKMKEWNSKISALFNNKLFSDVEFIIGKDSSAKLFGHKLILALRSEYFASSFYDEKVLNFNIEADEKALYLTMLKFIYTDKLELDYITEAEGLISLAKQFSIKDLELQCLAFLLGDVTVNNVLRKYEYAISNNIRCLLHVYRDFICDKAEAVLNSSTISILSADSLEDILKLENLKISSEMVVLKALLRWGEVQSDKTNDHSSLKKHIFPFMKHIRFLTLTENEFQSFLETYDILSGIESLILTKKILKPDSNVKIPEHICSIDFKRGLTSSDQSSILLGGKWVPKSVFKDFLKESSLPDQPTLLEEKKINFKLHNAFQETSSAKNIPDRKIDSSESDFCLTKCSSKDKQPLLPTPPSDQRIQIPVSNEKISVIDAKNLSKYLSFKTHDWSRIKFSSTSTLDDFVSKNVESMEKSKKSSNYPVPVTPLKSANEEFFPSNHGHRSNQKETVDSNTKISYEIKKQHSFTETQNSDLKKAFDCYQPVPNLCNTNPVQSFEFPLDESRHGLDLSFKKDVECSVSFEMKCGNLKISGFELFIKNVSKDKSENIKIEVDFAGFSQSSFSLTKELSQNVLKVKFPKLITLNGRKGKITISVDDLYGHRCRIAKTKSLEINRGPNWACSLVINSNMKVEQNLLFLINKLFYAQ